MFKTFSRRQFARLAGLAALGMAATPAIAAAIRMTMNRPRTADPSRRDRAPLEC
jgi:hypothetical protein